MFSGIDLKITPEGEVFCFEVNPSPGFNFYEVGTGQPISVALADLLHEAPSGLGATGGRPQHAPANAIAGV
jgi:D-alanine-D-alanine ligase-like ATP-grasp enzyme